MPSPPVHQGPCDSSLSHWPSLLLERGQQATATGGPLVSPIVAVLMCCDTTFPLFSNTVSLLVAETPRMVLHQALLTHSL